MPRDHYVAQTYLSHFCDATGQMHGYRKLAANYFPCTPYDVCHEWDGDNNPKYLAMPHALGAYRDMFERDWKKSVRRAATGQPSDQERLSLAGYVANLFYTTPAMVRVQKEILVTQGLNSMEFERVMRELHGHDLTDLPDEIAIDMVRTGRIEVELDPDYVKAKTTRKLLAYAVMLYHQDWDVLINDTAHAFVTSDNPAAFIESPGPDHPTSVYCRLRRGSACPFAQDARSSA